jgi:hypothetical protein
MAAPQDGQKREFGSTCVPHLGQNISASGKILFCHIRIGTGCGSLLVRVCRLSSVWGASGERLGSK